MFPQEAAEPWALELVELWALELVAWAVHVLAALQWTQLAVEGQQTVPWPPLVVVWASIADEA